jgi:ABC-type dipeptide/oligopeptide/nickel transport system permease subunit
MWVTTLNIVTLVAMLAALGYVAMTTRKLDASLGSLLHEGSEGRQVTERNLERVRRSLAEMERD